MQNFIIYSSRSAELDTCRIYRRPVRSRQKIQKTATTMAIARFAVFNSSKRKFANINSDSSGGFVFASFGIGRQIRRQIFQVQNPEMK